MDDRVPCKRSGDRGPPGCSIGGRWGTLGSGRYNLYTSRSTCCLACSHTESCGILLGCDILFYCKWLLYSKTNTKEIVHYKQRIRLFVSKRKIAFNIQTFYILMMQWGIFFDNRKKPIQYYKYMTMKVDKSGWKVSEFVPWLFL